MDSSQPSSERTCPSCSAPAEPKQRWCLECGAELPQSRRPALRSAVGIATTLTVLVCAASAGAYTLLQDGKEPPPPTQTIAQTPPIPTTPTVPPADDALPPTPTAPPLPGGGRGGGTSGDAALPPAPAAPPPPVDTSVPDLSDDLDTSSPAPPPADDTELDDDGSVRQDTGDDRQQRAQRQTRPRYVEANVAVGGTASVYAPYAQGNEDFGDTTKLVDGTSRTVWKSPVLDDPAAQPQIGVVVQLASPERVRRLIMQTPTPGMSVEIYASASASPPPSITAPGWSHLTDASNVAAKATIPIPGAGRYRCFLVWIRSLAADSDRAEISEIELIGLAPE
jgi:hypothetical protein